MKFPISTLSKIQLKTGHIIKNIRENKYSKIISFIPKGDEIELITFSVSYSAKYELIGTLDDNFEVYWTETQYVDLRNGEVDGLSELDQLLEEREFLIPEGVVLSSERRQVSAKLSPLELNYAKEWFLINNISANKFLRMCLIHRDSILKKYGTFKQKDILCNNYRSKDLENESNIKQGVLFD